MAGYTHKNLRDDVEDMAPQYGLAPIMEARFARVALECERTGISYQKLAPSARVPFGHRHAEQEEIYVVLSGSGRAKVDGEIVDLKPLDALRVAPTTFRAVEAGPDGLELIAFGGPRGVQDDTEMQQDWWIDQA
jgi:mannose-6-phosphate isomerase-like protein (cupin superfamily)